MEIRVENVRKTFRSDQGIVTALDGVNLVVPGQSVTTLLGPSGCGKTTLLRSIAGLETPDSGSISIGGTVVWSNNGHTSTFVTPDKRGLGMVFQTYAIWPHMTVFDNVAYPLEAQGVPRSEIGPKVARALQFVQLDGYEHRPATALSGGQQQRVSLARAIVSKPRVILFDEPLSNLDAKLREETRAELRELLTRLGVTSLYVTHDRFEALALSDIVVVMKDGRIVQQGTPEDVYFRADNRFVVDFIGKANFIPGEVQEAAGPYTKVQTSLGPLLCQPRTDVHPGQRGTVSIRIEFVEIANSNFAEVPRDAAATAVAGHGEHALQDPKRSKGNDLMEEHNRIKGQVKSVLFLGEYREVAVQAGEQQIVLRVHPLAALEEGQPVELYLNPEGCRFIR